MRRARDAALGGGGGGALRQGHAPGEAIAAERTFSGRRFEALGFADGSHVRTLAGTGDTTTSTFDQDFAAASVPRPATLPQLACALGGLAAGRRRGR